MTRPPHGPANESGHARLVIATGKKNGQHPSPATVMRMLREHDEETAAAVAVG